MGRIARGKGKKQDFLKLDGLFGKIRRSLSLERVPARRVLSGKKIAVFGAGALGGSIVVELARNGVEQILVVDQDHVEPGPLVRWPFGDSAYGMNKGSAFQEFVNKNYPDV